MPELDKLLDLFTPKQTARGYHPFVTTLPSRQAPKNSPNSKSRFTSRPAKTPSIKSNINTFSGPRPFTSRNLSPYQSSLQKAIRRHAGRSAWWCQTVSSFSCFSSSSPFGSVRTSAKTALCRLAENLRSRRNSVRARRTKASHPSKIVLRRQSSTATK